MAENKKKEESLADMFVVTQKGVHGRILRVGQRYSRGQLISMGGSVPGYCKREGTEEADEAIEESKTDRDGFSNNQERVSYLMAKGVPANVKMGTAKLKELISQHAGGVDPLKV